MHRGGIGAETARALAEENARLVLHYNSNRRSAEALAEELDVESVVAGADVSDESAVDAMYETAIAELGRIDALVVNAGIWIAETVPMHKMSLEQWRRTMDADLTGAFLSCRGFLRHLASVPRDDASIVLVASTAALFGEENHSDYSAGEGSDGIRDDAELEERDRAHRPARSGELCLSRLGRHAHGGIVDGGSDRDPAGHGDDVPSEDRSGPRTSRMRSCS